MEQPQYKLYTPELKESWSNGFTAFSAHPPIKRKTPCYLAGSGCHDKEHLGWVNACGRGNHNWELNFYRHPDGPDHYHCLYCGIANDLRYDEISGWFKVKKPRVPAHWIQDLEEEYERNKIAG